VAGGYDGTIKIDTSLDSTGFNKGVGGISGALGGLMGALKGVAAAIGIAFGVAALISFGKAAAKAASDMQVIMNMFRGVFGAQSNYAIQQLSALAAKVNMADDDLFRLAATLQNAAVAIGFTGRQSADMSIQLTKLTEDLATFYGVTDTEMAQTLMMAMQGMTRGLKQLGISISEADIKNKALTLGLYTGAGAVSETAKASAILALITDKTAAAQGNAEKTAHTWAGEMRGLTGAWGQFKEAFGNSIIIFAPVIAAITSVIKWLTVLTQYFAAVVGALFGLSLDTGAIAANTQAAATGTGDLADNTVAAGKAAKGALAAFDQLNVLKPEDTGTGGGGGVGVDTGALDAMKAKVAEFVKALKEFFAPLEAPLARLGAAFAALGGTIGLALGWVWDNILKPFGDWLVRTAGPVFLDMLTAAVNLLNTVLIALQPLGIWLWENFLKPLAAWTGQAILDALKWLTARLNDVSAWIKANPEAFRNMVSVLLVFVATWLVVNAAIAIWTLIAGVATTVTTAFGAAVLFLTSPIGIVILSIVALIAVIILIIHYWPQISQAASDAWAWIQQAWKDAGKWFADNVTGPIGGLFNAWRDDMPIIAAAAWQYVVDKWNGAKQWFTDNVTAPITGLFAAWRDDMPIIAAAVWQGIVDKWTGAKQWFVDTVTGPIGGLFNAWRDDMPGVMATAWTNVVNAWLGAKTWFYDYVTKPIQDAFGIALSGSANGNGTGGIVGFFTGLWNTVTGAAKTALNGIIDLMNLLIGKITHGINNIIDSANSVGSLVGLPGISRVTIGTIQHLAAGAVVPPNAPFMAMLGDNKSQNEILAPEDMIRRIVREETQGMGNQNINVTFGGSMGELIRLMKPSIDRENTRVGSSLVTRSSG
jgi:hypothetical protein